MCSTIKNNTITYIWIQIIYYLSHRYIYMSFFTLSFFFIILFFLDLHISLLFFIAFFYLFIVIYIRLFAFCTALTHLEIKNIYR